MYIILAGVPGVARVDIKIMIPCLYPFSHPFSNCHHLGFVTKPYWVPGAKMKGWINTCTLHWGPSCLGKGKVYWTCLVMEFWTINNNLYIYLWAKIYSGLCRFSWYLTIQEWPRLLSLPVNVKYTY